MKKTKLTRTQALALENIELMAMTSRTDMQRAKRFKKDTIAFAKISLKKFYDIELGESVYRIERPNGVVTFFVPSKIKFKAEGSQGNVALYLKGTIYDPEYPEEPYVRDVALDDIINYGDKVFCDEDDIPSLLEKEK